MQTFINLYGMMVLDKGADEKDIRFVLKADHLAALEVAECSNGELTIENDVLKEQIATLTARLRRHGDVETDAEEAAGKNYPSDHEAVMFLKTSTSLKQEEV